MVIFDAPQHDRIDGIINFPLSNSKAGFTLGGNDMIGDL